MGYAAQQLNRMRCEVRPGPVQAPHVPTLAEKASVADSALLAADLLKLENTRLNSELEQAAKTIGELSADNEGLRAALKAARSDLQAAQALVEEAGAQPKQSQRTK